jgi:hypothetical protein
MEQNPTPTPSTPHGSWPGAFGIYAPSRDAMKRNLQTLVVLVLIIIIGSSAINSLFSHSSSFLKSLASFAFSAYTTAALVHATLASVRGKHVELSEALRVPWGVILNMFLLSILIALSVAGGFLLLIVPAFFIIPRLVLAPYFLIDQKLGVVDAYKASWNASQGYVGTIYGIIGVTLLMMLPVITVVGVVVTAYLIFMYTASTALLYEYVKKHHRD